MKVLENKIKSKFPITIACEHCKSIVQLESDEDIKQITISVFDHKITYWVELPN
jgi:hypothetical protein